MNPDFWKNRSVFLTGHTGFKGGWMTLALSQMGAKVSGYSLAPTTKPNFFSILKLKKYLAKSTIGNILDLKLLKKSIKEAKPSIVIHMAAQPLVHQSYKTPIETIMTNVIGTANIFEAAKDTNTIKAIINVTTDKCYENNEKITSYKENDRLGGHDPYSGSKACSELITATYRKSFLSKIDIYLASARAGNVIGGGDWSNDRLLPDFFRSLEAGKPMYVRSPNAIRPWQHVLEPISGYMKLGEKLVINGKDYANAWNFGPNDEDAKTVGWVIDHLCAKIPGTHWIADEEKHPHESTLLKLDSTKAKKYLDWNPKWDAKLSIHKTIDWYNAWKKGKEMSIISLSQIDEYNSIK